VKLTDAQLEAAAIAAEEWPKHYQKTVDLYVTKDLTYPEIAEDEARRWKCEGLWGLPVGAWWPAVSACVSVWDTEEAKEFLKDAELAGYEELETPDTARKQDMHDELFATLHALRAIAPDYTKLIDYPGNAKLVASKFREHKTNEN